MALQLKGLLSVNKSLCVFVIKYGIVTTGRGTKIPLFPLIHFLGENLNGNMAFVGGIRLTIE